MPWSWDGDTESDTDPRPSCGGAVGTQVDSSNPGPVLTRGRRAEACCDTHIDVSSDEEPLVRPNMGRDVIARTEASGARNAESHIRSIVRADSTVVSDVTPGRDVLLNDRQTLETTQPATPVALRTAGVITDRKTECGATMPASPAALIATNRFFHVAIESESDSSTEEVPVPRRRPFRLVLVSQNVPVTAAAMEQEPPPDSHERRFRRVRQAMRMDRGVGQRQVEAAAQSIRRLASRVGPVIGEGIQREIRRHQWSALNVPLLWAAAEDDRLCPMIQWLLEVSQSLPMVPVAGVQMAGPDAVMTGWESLRDVMRSIEIRSREQFEEWIHNQGFPMPRWLGYISARVQERILNIAVAHDARVSALESVFVSVTLGECE